MRLEQIPKIAIQILEYGNRAIRLRFWFSNEDNPLGSVVIVISPEVVRVEEEEHTARGLIADSLKLIFS